MRSFLRRFNVVFILLVCIPALLVSVILSRLYFSALFATVAGQTESVVDQISRNIRSEVDGDSILLSALFNDGELRSLADRYARARTSGDRLIAGNLLEYKVASFFTYSNRVGAVTIFMKGGRVYYSQNYSKNGPFEGIDPTAAEEARREAGRVYILDHLTGPAGDSGEKSMLSLAVCTTPQDYDTDLDAILVRFRAPYFDSLRYRPQSRTAGDVVIYGRDGRVLLTSLPSSAGFDSPKALTQLRQSFGVTPGSATFRQLSLAGRSWLASSLHMDSTGWTVVVLVDRAAITGRITRYQWYLYPALLLLVALFVLYAHVVTAEREERERARMKAEMDALRFQIDPHFVSNTLNSIRLMARAARADAIAGMTQSLMRILADSYAGSGPLTTLEHEIENLAGYVGIMKVRFGETFDVSWSIADETKDLLVLKMILQPIMENAILHGISPAGRRGCVAVSSRIEPAAGLAPVHLAQQGMSAQAGHCLVIETRDDGVGMAEELARSVLSVSNGGNGGRGHLPRIGLANVHQRIRLNFGEPFGLSVQSVPGSFTLVRFVLPVMRDEGRRRA